MASKKLASQRMKLIIFLGSTREGRLGERVGKFVMNSLREKYEIKLFGMLTFYNIPYLVIIKIY